MLDLFLTISTATLREHGLSVAGSLAGVDNGRLRKLQPAELETVKSITGSTNLRFFRFIPAGKNGTHDDTQGVNLVGYISSVGFRSRQVHAVLYFPYKCSLWKIRDVLPHLLPSSTSARNRPRILIKVGRPVPEEQESGRRTKRSRTVKKAASRQTRTGRKK